MGEPSTSGGFLRLTRWPAVPSIQPVPLAQPLSQACEARPSRRMGVVTLKTTGWNGSCCSIWILIFFWKKSSMEKREWKWSPDINQCFSYGFWNCWLLIFLMISRSRRCHFTGSVANCCCCSCWCFFFFRMSSLNDSDGDGWGRGLKSWQLKNELGHGVTL